MRLSVANMPIVYWTPPETAAKQRLGNEFIDFCRKGEIKRL